MNKTKKAINSLLIILSVSILTSAFIVYKDNFLTLVKQKNISFLKDFLENPYGVEVTGDLVEEDELDNLEDSGIEFEEKSFSKTYYPYFELLNSSEKKLYNQLYANIENCATTFRVKYDITTKETENAIESIYNDHPEYFWLNTTFTYKYTPDKKVVQIILSYNDTVKNLNSAKTTFNSNANAIIDVARTLKSDFEKEKYVHDVLIYNINYDKNAVDNQSAYSALVNKKTVCAGYARAFQYIMMNLGIPTYYVTGYSSGEAHAWNIVLLENEYYNIDLTWDDGAGDYTYFNKTDKTLSRTHTRTGLSTNLPICTGTKYQLKPVKVTPSPSATPDDKNDTPKKDDQIDDSNHSNDNQVENKEEAEKQKQEQEEKQGEEKTPENNNPLEPDTPKENQENYEEELPPPIEDNYNTIIKNKENYPHRNFKQND